MATKASKASSVTSAKTATATADLEHDEPSAAHDHDHADPKLAHKAAHGATVSEIIKIFVVLIVLTGLELGVVYLPISKKLIVTGLVSLALSKAYTVAMYYMHLKGETRVMKIVVYLPMVFPALYAVALMLEGVYRHLVHNLG